MRFFITLSLVLTAGTASADLLSDAAKLGANAGAMEFCRDNFMTDDDNGRYALLVAATTKDFGKLEGDGKARALLARRAAKDGDYLGDPLNADRCSALRKVMITKYSID